MTESAPARRVAILTGTRADFGLLRAFAAAVDHDPRTSLLLIVSGSHLSEKHGSTIDEVAASGLPIAAKVPIWSGNDDPLAAATDFGTGVGRYAEALRDLEPDVVVVLGDRLEVLAMATAATIMGVPVAHIHGGEITEGAMDDSLRHAITKLSYLHFATTALHGDRIMQLGEEPDRVFVLGAPVLDTLAELPLLDRTELSERFGIRFGAHTALLTFHPSAFEPVPPLNLLRWLLEAIDVQPDTHLIVTGTNSDIGSAEIRSAIDDWVREHSATTDYVESFGHLGYLSAMAQSDLVAGNSSSTVLEAPLLAVPSVLVGDRQEGRPLSASVIHPASTPTAILDAVALALEPGFRRESTAAPTVFGTAGFAGRALEVLATTELRRPPRKKFWQLPEH